MNEQPNTGLIGKTTGLIRDKILQRDRLKALPNELQVAYEKALPQIESLYASKTFFWHGTGRYQYRDGKVIDVLEEIINNQGLIPNRDTYDSLTGVANTSSFALSRMYARIYSDMYLDENKKPVYEYGSRFFWATKFIGETALKGIGEALKDIGFNNIAKNPRGFMKRLKNNNRSWVNKFRSDAHTNPKSIRKIFTDLQADISGDYPILIGVEQNAFQPNTTAEYISKYERRTKDSVPQSKFTHIEVPLKKVSEVQQLLKARGVELPVIPIEVGERYCTQFNYQALVKGGYIKK